MAQGLQTYSITESQAQQFANLFRGFTNRFGSFEIPAGQAAGKQQGTARTVAGPIAVENYWSHLDGKSGLGIIPLLDDNENAFFGCIDIDRYDLDFKALEKDCSQLPIVITKSKSGGAHVWLFTLEPVSAKLIQEVLKIWAADLGFAKSEIFPKQIKRLTQEDAGNWINLPYFGGKRVAFFNGQEHNLDEFLVFAQTRRMNTTTIQHFVDEVNAQPLFHDGPPCLATLAAKGIGSGSRNMVLLNIGSYFKKKDPTNFLARLLEFNKKHLVDPLTDFEIQSSIAKSLQRKSYPYQCNQEPLCSACNRPACLKREFGVGGSSDELEVTVDGLTKVATEPPTWYVNIDGVRVEMGNIDTLLAQKSFRSLAAETIHKLFPMIKPGAWDKMANTLLEKVEVIEAPPDSSFGGQLNEELREFIQAGAQDDGMDQIVMHTVFIDMRETRAYFRSSDFVRRIRRNLGPTASPQKAWAFLRNKPELEAKNDEYMVDTLGRIRLWSVSIKDILIPAAALSNSMRMLETANALDKKSRGEVDEPIPF